MKERSIQSFHRHFSTAGREFEVITDTHKISVVVPYGNEPKRLLEELSQTQTEAEKKKILRKLQRYTFGISEKQEKTKLGNAIYENGGRDSGIM